MPHIKAKDAVIFTLPQVTFSGLAAPSRGARETSVWRVRLDPFTPGNPHSLSREEVLVALSGQAEAVIGGVSHDFKAGDALIVPADTAFSLANPSDQPFEAMAVLPVGGQARIGADPAFVPPWAL